ncbi:hypothetical protein EDD11_005525 [Mortierella claussenii]|nr:hypothetical protein EDD11_005525 [Mortierella claussenii]
MLLVVLALLIGATLTAAWDNVDLQNWDNGWDHNILANPLTSTLLATAKTVSGINLPNRKAHPTNSPASERRPLANCRDYFFVRKTRPRVIEVNVGMSAMDLNR